MTAKQNKPNDNTEPVSPSGDPAQVEETEDRNQPDDYKVYTREPDGSISDKAPVAEYSGHVGLGEEIEEGRNADR